MTKNFKLGLVRGGGLAGSFSICFLQLCFIFIFGLLRGKNENVLQLPKNHFKDLKVADFPHVREEGVNQHMENSICFLQIFFESFPYS